MGSSIFSSTSIMLLLVFLSSTAKSDFDISPTHSPFFDNMCDQVNCGRGNCSVDDNTPFNFVCKCDPGWRRTILSDNQHDLQFLPCVIPDCSLDMSCMPANPPTPHEVPHNNSIFDPCFWTFCGEGTCNKNHTTRQHTCDCNPGYANLMNISNFPCFRDCAIGTDCRKLGVRSSDTTTPTDDSSQGVRFLSGRFDHCIGVIMMYVVLVLWK